MSRARDLANRTIASAALPKAGGAMTGAITTNSTFDGIDIAVRDAIHAPKAGPTFTGTVAIPNVANLETAVVANTAKVSFTPDAAQVFNDTGADVDFRVEGSGAANALFVQGSDGKVGLGTDAPVIPLHIAKSNTHKTQGNIALLIKPDAGDECGLVFEDSSPGYSACIKQKDGQLKFWANATTGDFTGLPGMLLDGAGKFYIGNSTALGRTLSIASTDATVCHIRTNHDTSGYIMQWDINNSVSNTTARFLYCNNSDANKLNIYSNGDVQNVNGIYGSSLSDERLKIDVKNANSQWEDVKNINIVNYKRLVDGEDSKSMLSVIAQQVKEVSPNLVGERPPEKYEVKANPIFGTLYKEGDEIPEPEEGFPQKEIGDIKEEKEKVLFFKDSIFFWKCAKALQEAMAKIETLEAKVTALESA